MKDAPGITRIITANLNGIRAATAKGWFKWMARQGADIVCVQEIRVSKDDLTRAMRPRGWHSSFCHADKRGYSGVAIWSRVEPLRVVEKLGVSTIDCEGRFLRVDYPGLSVISLYLPSGSSGPVRQAIKMAVLEELRPILRRMRRERRQLVLCGDFNIAHTRDDLENWRSNQKNSGFLPEERAYMEELFGTAGWVDAFRVVNRERGHYTFWSNRGQSWAKNVGWRIDYQVITPGLADRVIRASIYKRKRFADHSPLTIDYRWDLAAGGALGPSQVRSKSRDGDATAEDLVRGGAALGGDPRPGVSGDERPASARSDRTKHRRDADR